MNSDLLRKLVEAHFSRDEGLFQTTLRTIIREEERKRQTVLADDLNRLLKSGTGEQMQRDLTQWRKVSTSEIPKDGERGLPLLEVKKPGRRLDQLVLEPSIRHSLERVIVEYRQSELLQSHGLQPMRKLLFFGPPGCGKTITAEALANDLYLPFVLIRFDALVSSYLGETASNLRKIFDFIQKNPCLALFDEFDAIGKSRISPDEHGEIKRVINSFLQILDGFQSESILIAATNHDQLLDLALWRRFDDVIEFRPPNLNSIEDILLKLASRFSVDQIGNLTSFAKRILGASHADVERIVIDSIKTIVLNGDKKLSLSAFEEAFQKHALRSRPVSKPNKKRKRSTTK